MGRRHYDSIEDVIDVYLALLERTRYAGAPAIDPERQADMCTRVWKGQGPIIDVPEGPARWLDEFWRLEKVFQELERRVLRARPGQPDKRRSQGDRERRWIVWMLRKCGGRRENGKPRLSWRAIAAHPACKTSSGWALEYGEQVVDEIDRELMEILSRWDMFSSEGVRRAHECQEKIRHGPQSHGGARDEDTYTGRGVESSAR